MEPRMIVLIAFVSITVLTALAVLGAAVGWLPQADPKLISWGIPTVLGEIVATMVMFFKAQWGSRIVVNLTFDGLDPADIDLDTPNCSYTIVDSSGRELSHGSVAPNFGHGGWQIKLPVTVSPDQSVSLTLKTQTGERWQVRPFLPLVHTQAAAKIG
jgi:hypothetical protein